MVGKLMLAAAGLLVFITALGFFITPALLGGRRETMISQIIISVVQELLNWRFAGSLSVVLLAAAAIVSAARSIARTIRLLESSGISAAFAPL